MTATATAISPLAWKPGWERTRERFCAWWERRGCLVGSWGAPSAERPHAEVPDPGPAGSLARSFLDTAWRVPHLHRSMAVGHWGADSLPIACPAFGPGSLGTFLGAEPQFTRETVWYEHCWEHLDDPESTPPLRFDPENRWWQLHLEQLAAVAAAGRGRYLAGLPDLIENLDILESLRGGERMLADMIDRPEWVEAKLAEINQVWFAAAQRMFEVVRQPDGSTAFWAFMLWSPGTCAKLQCDSAAMFGPRMFKRFVVPVLSEQCAWLDHSLFHLDGSQCLVHLDHLLAIDDLDAIEWTPDPKVPGGGDPHWYPLYRRIRAAGKGVQAVGVRVEQIAPLLDAVGPAGVYLLCNFADRREMDEAERIAERYR